MQRHCRDSRPGIARDGRCASLRRSRRPQRSVDTLMKGIPRFSQSKSRRSINHVYKSCMLVERQLHVAEQKGRSADAILQEVEGLDAPVFSPVTCDKQLDIEEAWLAEMIQVSTVQCMLPLVESAVAAPWLCIDNGFVHRERRPGRTRSGSPRLTTENWVPPWERCGVMKSLCRVQQISIHIRNTSAVIRRRLLFAVWKWQLSRTHSQSHFIRNTVRGTPVLLS